MIKRLYDRFLDVLDVLPGAFIGLIAIAIGIDVLFRNVDLPPLIGLIEVVEYGLFGLTCVGMSTAMRRGAHVTVDVVITALPLRYQRIMLAVAMGLSVLIAVGILAASIIALRDAIQSGSEIYKIYVFPEWWLYAAIIAGVSLLIIECVRKFLTAFSEATPRVKDPNEAIEI